VDPIGKVAEVFDAIQHVKAGSSAFCTNFFPDQRKLEVWLAHSELLAESRTGAAFFLRRDRDFWHFYFCAANMASLRLGIASLPSLKNGPVVVDLVGNETALRDLPALFESEGFRGYARLYRLARTSQESPQQPDADESDVVFARKADCRVILDLLGLSFDRYAEQLPMLYEIESAVESGQILVVKRDATLAGLLFFETQGFTSTIRYWLVAEQFRALRLGSVLMRHYLASQTAVRRFVLWVIANNADAIEKYQHYGFTPDGLLDLVLANQMVRP
jgi:ribosomal protein S18 acetylase RimI-like enzyme